jgi:uncharacterized membrane protein
MIAGQVMTGLGVITIFLTSLSIFGMAYLMWGTQHRWLRFTMRTMLVAAALFWIVGSFVYGSIYAAIHDNTSDSSMGPGLMLAIVLSVLQLILVIIGLSLMFYLNEQGNKSRRPTMVPLT